MFGHITAEHVPSGKEDGCRLGKLTFTNQGWRCYSGMTRDGATAVCRGTVLQRYAEGRCYSGMARDGATAV
jgi:hypothetical protein